MTSSTFSGRSFSTDSGSVAAPAENEKKEEDNEPQSFMEVARKYGLYPLYVLGGAALVSKEFYIINPETLFLGNSLMIYFGVYVLASESINEWITKGVAAQNKKITDIVDLEKVIIENRIDVLKSRMSFPAFLEKLKAAEITSMEALYEAKTREMHIKAASTVESELAGAKDRIARDAELEEHRENEELAVYIDEFLNEDVTEEDHLEYLDAMVDNFDNLSGKDFHFIDSELNPLHMALEEWDHQTELEEAAEDATPQPL